MFIGEIAALGAAFSFSMTSVLFTFAGRKLSANTIIAVTLPVSWLVIALINIITIGELVPASTTLDRWFLLSMSGILAFVISSYFILNAYQYIGPRLTMLIASFAPVLGAIFAWIFLGQTLPANSTIGIALVLFGIIWVVAERNSDKEEIINKDIRRGAIFACLGTVAQGLAFVFSSQGVSEDFPPFSASLMRITTSMLALWVIIIIQGKLRPTLRVFTDDLKTLAQLIVAAITGPVIAGSLLLVSLQLIPVGVSTTLSHTTAIILIPVGYFVFKEHISFRTIIGTIIAILGIAILFI